MKARFIKLTNYRVPGGTFALAGLRIFGNGGGKVPSKIAYFSAERSQDDRCVVNLKWDAVKNAIGYNIRYGTQKDKLYHNYQVFATDSLTIRSLNSQEKYYFTIDAFNENGVTKDGKLIEVK